MTFGLADDWLSTSSCVAGKSGGRSARRVSWQIADPRPVDFARRGEIGFGLVRGRRSPGRGSLPTPRRRPWRARRRRSAAGAFEIRSINCSCFCSSRERLARAGRPHRPPPRAAARLARRRSGGLAPPARHFRPLDAGGRAVVVDRLFAREVEREDRSLARGQDGSLARPSLSAPPPPVVTSACGRHPARACGTCSSTRRSSRLRGLQGRIVQIGAGQGVVQGLGARRSGGRKYNDCSDQERFEGAHRGDSVHSRRNASMGLRRAARRAG